MKIAEMVGVFWIVLEKIQDVLEFAMVMKTCYDCIRNKKITYYKLA